MSTLLLRLAAFMQSWGADSKFERRSTERAPTKSGVLGLVSAALGRRRDEDISDLEALRFGVRVDKEGVLLRDFHTAKSLKSAYVTNRYYLADAVFLAGLEGSEALLEDIEAALRRPVYPLYLGRRSCPPEGRLCLGIREGKEILEALKEEPYQAKLPPWQKEALKLRLIVEANAGEGASHMLRDAPISFDQRHRKYGFRRLVEMAAIIQNPVCSTGPLPTEHDAIAELEVEECIFPV
ncbi:MAG TPA: type I-E CRISPR-associated protein Cas5/CasD [Clostridia bacterium]|nr:type I-E CRISPR-associated protein Cas5/CasD [Clostridia bacterium]